MSGSNIEGSPDASLRGQGFTTHISGLTIVDGANKASDGSNLADDDSMVSLIEGSNGARLWSAPEGSPAPHPPAP